MKLIKVQTIGGETHKLKTTYQEARRALNHAGTVVLIYEEKIYKENDDGDKLRRVGGDNDAC